MKSSIRIIVYLFIFLTTNISLAQTFTLTGKVYDKETGTPLSGANISLQSNKILSITDTSGVFKILLTASSNSSITVSHVGYASATIAMYAKSDTTCNISLVQRNNLPDITIYGTKNPFGINSSQMSTLEIPHHKIRMTPIIFGETDILKTIQKLPGVQASNDGQAGIYVRGGNYDQNQIILDRATIYNAEHMKGFLSAINPDIVNGLTFYKGAFPARYGGQLSSIVDIEIKDGDSQNYHGQLSLGLISSKIQLEGPIFKNRTSFNIAMRKSHTGLIVMPILKSIADNKHSVTPYTNLNFQDISTKVAHKINTENKVSSFLYIGKDISNDSPSSSEFHSEHTAIKLPSNKDEATTTTYSSNSKSLSGLTLNNWRNILGSINWDKTWSQEITMTTFASYSQYNYFLHRENYLNENSTQIIKTEHPNFTNTDTTKTFLTQKTYKEDISKIQEFSTGIDINISKYKNHLLKIGTKLSLQQFSPRVNTYLHKTDQSLGCNNNQWTEFTNYDYTIDTSLWNGTENLYTASIYIEDDFTISKKIRCNLGLRYVIFNTNGKIYNSIEPRISSRWLLNDNSAIKISYARMAQGIHLLSSSNIVSPSDIWTPITANIPPMISDQFAIGYNLETNNGINLSLEGYFKRMKNLIEYNEGASFHTAGKKWDNIIAIGNGESYGLELHLQKDKGATTGWISYTLSRTTRLFNKKGMELNGGNTFYDGADRPHNLNILINQKFSQNFDISISWMFQSGRRGNLTTTSLLGGIQGESSNYHYWFEHWNEDNIADFANKILDKTLSGFAPLYSYGKRNSIQLPSIHRLDISANYHIYHKLAKQNVKSTINFSVNNLYNRKNISNLYWCYYKTTESDIPQMALKGVCLLPIMPSLTYTLKF